MAKISEYTNYGENVPSGGTTAKFQETGVIPVSGKYKDDGTMETRNVKMSDLVGGGGGDAESLAGRGLQASDGKLTVDTDDTLTIVEVGYLSETHYKVSVTNAVPPTTDASDGDVLTYKDSDGIVWAPAQGGGGTSGIVANADVSDWKHDGAVPSDYTNCGAASLVPEYTVTGTTARVEWKWKFAPNDSAGWSGTVQSGSFEL